MAIGPQWPDPAKKIFQFPHGRAPTLPSAKPSVQLPSVRLRHMLDEIDAVLAATKYSSAEEIMDDYLKRRAVERAIQIISEAAKELPPEVRAEEPDVPWASIIAIGNY